MPLWQGHFWLFANSDWGSRRGRCVIQVEIYIRKGGYRYGIILRKMQMC